MNNPEKSEYINGNTAEEAGVGEQVVILLKPGSSEFEDRLNEFLQDQELNILDRKKLNFDADTIKKFYPHADDKFFPNMEDYFSQEETIALLVSGQNAIKISNSLKRHVRGILHLRQPRDGIHVSDDPAEAERERAVLGLEYNNDGNTLT